MLAVRIFYSFHSHTLTFSPEIHDVIGKLLVWLKYVDAVAIMNLHVDVELYHQI